MARFMAERLNRATGDVAIVVPTKGYSAYAVPGGPFWDPQADEAFLTTLRGALRPSIPVHVVDDDINGEACIGKAVSLLQGMLSDMPR